MLNIVYRTKHIDVCSELVRRFSKPEDVVGGSFGGAGTACLAANIERRQAIYIDTDTSQSEACRARWSRAQWKLMGEHLRFVRRGDENYIRSLTKRAWLFPSSTFLRQAPESGRIQGIKQQTEKILQSETFAEEVKEYNKAFSSLIRDPFNQVLVHPAGAKGGSAPDWLDQESFSFKEAGHKKETKVLLRFLFHLML